MESGHLNVLRTIVGRRIAPIRKEFVIGGSHSLTLGPMTLKYSSWSALSGTDGLSGPPSANRIDLDVLSGLLSSEDLGDVERLCIFLLLMPQDFQGPFFLPRTVSPFRSSVFGVPGRANVTGLFLRRCTHGKKPSGTHGYC